MKKLIITVVLTISAALTGMTAWAAAIGGSALTNFSSGSTISSADMNANFTVIKDAVNANSSLRATLPAGVSTYLGFYLATPADYSTGDTTVVSYWRGCEGTDVRLGHNKLGYSTGSNGNVAVLTTVSTEPVAVAGGFNYTIFQSSYVVTSGFASYNFMTFTIGRAGGDAADTCTGNLTLLGVELTYPTSAGTRSLSVPVTSMSR